MNPKQSRQARGYGERHQALRRLWDRRIQAGDVACVRCGRAIVPGAPWDLGHDDLNRSIHTGPEHRRCNRAAGGQKRAHNAKLRRRAMETRTAHRLVEQDAAGASGQVPPDEPERGIYYAPTATAGVEPGIPGDEPLHRVTPPRIPSGHA